MNPLDPKISHALKDIEKVYSGSEAAHGYYDAEKKFYVLVVSGEEAAAYHQAVRAIHDLAANSRQLAPHKK
jgi:hypothetical protein